MIVSKFKNGRQLISKLFFYFAILFFCLNLSSSVSLANVKTNPNPNHLSAFLILTDIHFNHFSGCESMVPCSLIEKLRQVPVEQWPKILAVFNRQPSKYGEDTNYFLLTAILGAAKQKAEQENIKFVLVLGDFLGHDFRASYKKYSRYHDLTGYTLFVQKTFEFLSKQLNQTFPHVNVYAVVGNNDSYTGDYQSQPNGKFFQDGKRFWGYLIKDSVNRNKMMREFTKGGYYTVNIVDPFPFSIIVLNSNFFSVNARGKNIDFFADQQLDWLHHELQLVKSKHQKAFIVMHIPDGIHFYALFHIRLFTLVDLWKKNYIQRFQRELKQFAPQIAAIFVSHLHTDWLQLLTFNRAVGIPAVGTVSVSPIFGNDPGFKICQYDSTSLEIENLFTYYYHLHN